MRLINVHTFELEEFIGNSIPFHEYAILSHTWGDHELLFTDMTDLERVRLTKPVGFAKLEGSCALAKRQGLKYVWIDTCCIDKSSSAELSEAINSMYMWYQKSRICYAYLSDVSTLDGSGHQQSEVLEQVGRSRWFTRGWTLQELLAPKRVEFYTANWDYIGKKDDDKLLTILSQASLVDECVLANIVSLDKISVAKKMYWASRRETTRTEDIAYCLLGIFGVNMPLLYGEGMRAFIRLQQEIIKATNDQSIFAWYCAAPGQENQIRGALAPSPRCFALSGDIWPLDDPSTAIPRDKQEIECPGTAPKFWAVADFERPPRELKLVVLHCQLGPVPGTFPTLLVIPSWSCDGMPIMVVERYFWHGKVTKVSLRPLRILWEGFSQTLDLQQAARLAGQRDSATTTFPVQGHPQQYLHTSNQVDVWDMQFLPVHQLQRIMISMTELLGQGIAVRLESRSHNPVSIHIRDLAPKPFWILPQTQEEFGNVVTICDVCPRRRWNPGSHRFYWNKEEPEVSERARLMKSIHLGVARIALESSELTGTTRPQTALLFFGVTQGVQLTSIGVGGIREDRLTNAPWCFLQLDGGEDLTTIYNNPDLRRDDYIKSQQQQIDLSGGLLTLGATVQRAKVSGERCYVIRVGLIFRKDEQWHDDQAMLGM